MASKTTLSMWMRATLAVLVVLACCSSIVPVEGKKGKSNGILKGEEKLAKVNSLVKDGIIHFTTQTYMDLVLRPDRPYHLVVLYTAMADKFGCEVCKQVHPEFLTLGASYVTAKQVKVDTRDGLDVFFAVVDFDDNQEVYGVHGFTSAPHIGYIAPDRNEDAGKRPPSKLEIAQQNLYNVYQNGKKAEDMVSFIKQKTGFEFEIQRSKAFLYTLVVTFLVVIGAAAKLVLSNLNKVLEKLRRRRLWMTVSLLFYGLSVSGMVYCIIRDPPAYSQERNGQIKYFHPGGRQQYVVEGLIVGGYDVLAAGFVILLSQWAIYLERPYLRYPALVGCMLGFILMYRQMISAYIFKNRWYTGWMGL